MAEEHQTRTDCDDGNEHLYLIYLKKFNRRDGIWPTLFEYSKYWRTFNRWCSLILGAYISNVDLCASAEEDNSSKITQPARFARWWIGPSPIERSAWRRQLKYGWLSWALLAVNLMLFTYLSTDVVYLYRHEINRMRLIRVQDLIVDHGPERLVAIDQSPVGLDVDDGQATTRSMAAKMAARAAGIVVARTEVLMSLGELRIRLKKRVDELKLEATATDLGDKLTDWGILNLCVFAAILFLNLSLYLLAMWLYLCAQKHDCRFHRDHFNRQAEECRVDALGENQALKYLESNRVFAAIVADETTNGQPPRGRVSSRAALRRPTRKWALAADGSGNHVASSDHKISYLLVQMLTCGALRPINRCRLWLEYRDLAHACLYLVTIFYLILFETNVLLVLYSRTTSGFNPDEVCMLVTLSMITCAAIYYVPTMTVSCLDQALLVRQMLALIRECIRLNEQAFAQLSHVDNNNNNRLAACIIERINSNYVFALMTYKIFVAQFASFKRTNRGVCFICFVLGFTIPIVARVHMPYLENDDLFGLILLLFSLAIQLPLNMICVPMCYLNARCQDLYANLSSLMAHIAKVRQQHGEHGASIYNEHAVTVLLKELANPKQLLEQFVVRSPATDSTYPNLVRLYFWWGLVVVSFLLNAHGDYQDQFFGSFSRDPLGVWCFKLI